MRHLKLLIFFAALGLTYLLGLMDYTQMTLLIQHKPYGLLPQVVDVILSIGTICLWSALYFLSQPKDDEPKQKETVPDHDMD